MCHHYKGSRTPPEHLANEFSVRSNLYQLMLPDEGFYPLDYPPIVRMSESGEREMVAAQWGLLPFWWRPTDRTPKRTTFQRKCFNARSEEADVKPTFREAFKRRRCLLPADEFFERGHYFHLPDFRPFAFAGLWEQWRGADEVVESCTLLTAEANDEVRSVGHPRMPVILTKPEQYADWLQIDRADRSAVESLLQPLSDGELLHYRAVR
ncbi:MAG TPA: SOS response-associated peptidase [Lacipirellulaceae bacterium]|nr:SOS response-associated peptidase [Lacipirellulaceae bacterium]HMP05386.1 SOS response-associated peptidase [Lacipirellulaceae bacterium]